MSRTLAYTLLIATTLTLALAGYNETLAFDYAHVAAATSCPSDQLLNLSCGSYCDYLKENGYSVYFSKIYDQGDSTSVSFSMFYNKAKKLFVTSFRQTISDKQVLKEFLGIYGTAYTLHSNLQGNPAVFHYFYDKYTNVLRADVITNLKKALKEFPADTSILFTGHSLGSALTTQAALDAKLEGLLENRNVQVYAFGSPRVGNYDFASLYNSLLPETYRIIHYKDTSTRIPPCVWNVFTGECVKSSINSLLWAPYHVNNEVYYYEGNMAFGDYVVCQDEDESCQREVSLINSVNSDHDHYFNITMLCVPWEKNIF
mmetsp:Transcript_62761/g.73012  ORF Transcript_62761/g.73012 Transcript_62761/m.73012 type:complete len:315 (+) Transcript_62761:25-969(+)